MAGAGHDFMFMWSLAYKAYTSVCKDEWVLKNFSPALMIAISWEETQFNTEKFKDLNLNSSFLTSKEKSNFFLEELTLDSKKLDQKNTNQNSCT